MFLESIKERKMCQYISEMMQHDGRQFYWSHQQERIEVQNIPKNKKFPQTVFLRRSQTNFIYHKM